MEGKKQKVLTTCLEVILLVMLLPFVYWAGFRLLLDPINYFAGDWFFTPLGVLVVLGLDLIWIIIVRLAPIKSIKFKVVLVVLVLTLSASVLTGQVLLSSLGNMAW